MKALVNAKVVMENEIIENGVILFDKGRIVEAGSATDVRIPDGCERVDAQGCYAGPGFVDNHCHGGGSVSLYEADLAEAAAHHLAHGTTSLAASVPYNISAEATLAGIDSIVKAMREENPGNISGIFMEGPFNNPKFGANSSMGRPINQAEYEEIYRRGGKAIRHWMYAPELEHGDEFARFVVSKGIPLAIGHTCASPAVVAKAVGIGATICTHLFDAMGCHLGNDSVSETGIIQDTAADAALVTDDLYLEIICDSNAIHVKPANLKLAYKCGGPDRVVLITDATVRVGQKGDVNINENGELSGSLLTMDGAFKNMHHYTNAPITHLFKMASSTPAKAIRIFDEVGSIEKGKLANIVLLDEKLDLKKVFLKGELVS